MKSRLITVSVRLAQKVDTFRSQMTALTDTNGQVFSYAFDGDGNRISQGLNDCLSARYIYDGANVVLELNGSNEVIHAVVNGPGIDQPVERIAYVTGEPRLRQVYHTDGLGSVALMTDEAQAPIKTYAYDAFGRIRSETSELVMNRWTYTGREALGDSAGLYYYRWRVMDPNTGRFTSEDPLGFVDGLNIFWYAVDNPIIYIDPNGEIGQIGIAVIGTTIIVGGYAYMLLTTLCPALYQQDQRLEECRVTGQGGTGSGPGGVKETKGDQRLRSLCKKLKLYKPL